MAKFIKDPIYGIIEIENKHFFIYELLQTKEMKRLKNILQLGECFNVFFSATHTRYNHSIGVYRNAKKIIENINVNINEEDIKVILSAALLHDLGHGPRSHCFEKWTKHDHEKMTNNIILNPQTEVHQILKKYQINPKDVVDIISHKSEKQFYYQIVSSQIDADRLDYLLRDSYFTGAIYGRIDIDILLKWIQVKDNQLTFNSKAIGLIEELLFSRFQMFKQVYINKKVLCYQYLIEAMFKRFKTLKQSHYKFKDQYQLFYLLEPFVNEQEWSIPLFLEFDDNKMNLIIQSFLYEDDEVLHSLADNYLYQNHYYCYDHQQDGECLDKFKDSFTLYNKKEPIMINDGRKIISFENLNDNNILKADKNQFEFNFYIYRNPKD